VRPGTLRVVVPIVVALGALALSACGQRTERAPEVESLQMFVGKVEDSAGYVGVISDGERMSGFVTDGVKFGKWFATAELNEGEAPLIARDGFELGEVKIADDEASGEVLVGLTRHGFEAVKATGEGGLFTASEQNGANSFEAGWVVLPDGSEEGTYDTFVDEVFSTHPAPRLKPSVNIPGFGTQAPHLQTSLFLDLNTQAP
jgi:hypothetical protein